MAQCSKCHKKMAREPREGVCAACRQRITQKTLLASHSHGRPDSNHKSDSIASRIESLRAKVEARQDLVYETREEDEMTPEQERAFRASLPESGLGTKGGYCYRGPRTGRLRRECF